MTSQMTDQSLLPGPLAGTAAPDAPGARHCKQPGCGSELPAAAGRGAPRLFCSPACSRKWHNDHRPAVEQAAAGPGPAAGPLAALHQLLTDAASLVAGAAAELATADPGRVTAALAAADAARRQAQAETAVALARAAQAAQDAGQPPRRSARPGTTPWPRWRPPTPHAPTRTPPTHVHRPAATRPTSRSPGSAGKPAPPSPLPATRPAPPAPTGTPR
jgi:hypothetical protein